MLSFHNVTLQYETKVVLKGVNLHIKEGEFVTLVGPSGCGKSSLLNLAAGTLKPTTGSVSFGGNQITGIDPQRGMMFQDSCLFPWLSAWENVAFGLKMKGIKKKERYEQSLQYLDQVELREYADYRSYELSGGMKQRVALARTLIQEPQLILMDEPLGALDAITKRKMQGLFKEIWRSTQKTFFLVTHDVEEAIGLGTRLLVLSVAGGELLEDLDLQREPRNKSDLIHYIYQLLANGMEQKQSF